MTRRLSDIFDDNILTRKNEFIYRNSTLEDLVNNNKARVNILALGDVGSSLLQGLVLQGQNKVQSIGIFDLNQEVCQRFEAEMNQIRSVGQQSGQTFPKVEVISQQDLFDCDVFIFTATKGVPDVKKGETETRDVRMIQLEANSQIVQTYARQAIEAEYKGLFAVVSDPVDQLCAVAVKTGLDPRQVRGFGLGVMYARACYYADRMGILDKFMENGRVFGPHGQKLVLADDLSFGEYDFMYDQELSNKLQQETVNANKVIRKLGFKPYIAPALSSGALSILNLISGRPNHSSIFFGRGFMGCLNQVTDEGVSVENLPLPDHVFDLVLEAYQSVMIEE